MLEKMQHISPYEGHYGDTTATCYTF